MKTLVSRRMFIKTAGVTAIGSVLPGSIPGCGKAKYRKLKEIGLQLLTIQDALDEDYVSALEKVAAIGYRTLEMGAHLGPSPEKFMDLLKQLGLKALAGGASMVDLQKSLQQIIDLSLDMDKRYLICYWPWTDSPQDKLIDDWKKLCDTLNKIGAACNAAGLVFAYHNHDIEFRQTEGRIPYDVIVQNTDPALVKMLIDLYWVVKGRQDPLTYFDRYPGRFPVWHVKDMDEGADRSFACVGQGNIDFQAIFNEADKAGMMHVFVEHDRPAAPIECARTSFEYLSSISF